MDIHILDFVVYIIGLIIIWNVLPEDYKEELGVLMGIVICIIYTIIYVVIFVVFDNNISDISFMNLIDINIKL